MLFPRLWFINLVFFIVATKGSCVAAESFTIDLPVKTSLELPSRLAQAPQQVTTPEGTGYATFSILPEIEGEALFVTVVFKEDGKEGPAVFWTNESDGQQTTISENLADGVIGLNQRTIAIPHDLASAAGKLVLTGDQSKILRVRLDWVPASPVFVAADQQPVALIIGDRPQSAAELTGIRSEGLPDTWFGSVLDAPLQDRAESIEGSIGFSIPISSPVSQVLLRAEFLGLPLDQSVTIWVNGQSVGSVQPTVPPLTDSGYITNDQGSTSYAGWRSGAILLPSSLFKEGENSIQIESKTSGVFIRDAALQLRSPKPEASKTENSAGQNSGTMSN